MADAVVIPLDPVRAYACRRCGRTECVVQVDTVEALYPVHGERRLAREVLVDPDEARVDLEAIDRQFYRCRRCQHEWPLEPGTRFVLAPEPPARR
jgi:hypothetical protein